MSLEQYRFIAPPHAPLNAHGELALEIVERQAAFFHRQGVKAVFVSGTTGECSSLTDDERVSLAQRWCEVGSQHAGNWAVGF